MLRSIWIIFIASVITFICSILAIIGGIFNPFSKFNDGLIRFWARSILKVAGIKIVVEGREKIDLNRSYIYVSNHQGTFDILATVAVIPGTVRFVAKKELFRIPLFAQGMRSVGMVEIDRGHSKKARDTINKTADIVKNKVSVIIFAEGTRSEDGKIRPFKKGAFILAMNGKTPIMPMVISGSRHIMKKKNIRLRKGLVKLNFLEPVTPDDPVFEDRNALMEKVRGQIIENYEPDFGIKH